MPRKKTGENKFDPPTPEEKWEPEQCDTRMNENAEAFLVFCRRALGTSATAPLVVAGEPLNGASIGNLAEAYAICYGLGKAGALPVPKGAPPAEDNPLAARRAALNARNGADDADA